MVRALLIAFVIVLGFAACGPKPAPPAPAPAAESGDPLRPVQNGEKPDITAGKISKDIVGRVVDVPELSGAGPSDKWTFEASEYRHIDILEKRPTQNGIELLVFMLSRSNTKEGEADVQVSGRLRLRYEWQGAQWVLRRIENVSFRYSVGVAT